MRLVVYSPSPTFEQFLRAHLEIALEFGDSFAAPLDDPDHVYLLHWSRDGTPVVDWLQKHAAAKPVKAGVCADVPEIRSMLACVRLGARAYCNSHMAAIHYSQMLRLLGDGQSWFPPGMLAETFHLAQRAIDARMPDKKAIDILTPREQEVAFAVSEGKSNRQIATQMKISEPTVKSHLTNIFSKLEIKDRVSLALYLRANS